MNAKIHPLQEKIIPILKDLQYKYNKPITKAMLTLSQGRYPSIQEILNTLDHYNDQDLIKLFNEENSNLIEDAKNNKKEESANTEEEDLSSIFSNPPESKIYTNAYKSIKGIPLKSIEDEIAAALKKLSDGDFKVNLISLKKEGFDAVEFTIQIHGDNFNHPF